MHKLTTMRNLRKNNIKKIFLFSIPFHSKHCIISQMNGELCEFVSIGENDAVQHGYNLIENPMRSIHCAAMVLDF